MLRVIYYLILTSSNECIFLKIIYMIKIKIIYNKDNRGSVKGEQIS